MYKVLDYYTKEVVADGFENEKSAERFILNMLEPVSRGRRIYRVIQEPDGNVYDIGSLYKIVADGK